MYHLIDAANQTELRRFYFSPKTDGASLIQEDVLRQELTFLAGNDMRGRLSGAEDHVKASNFIIEKLKQLNIPPATPGSYLQEFTMNVGPTANRKTHNIVSILKGADQTLSDEYIVIGAHLDHAGTRQFGYTCNQAQDTSDQICNGADDNGSGTIALLNVAKALASVRANLKRSIVIMWFSCEEVGLLGSKYYVAHPLVPLDKTVYMINLDMVGNLQ